MTIIFFICSSVRHTGADSMPDQPLGLPLCPRYEALMRRVRPVLLLTLLIATSCRKNSPSSDPGQVDVTASDKGFQPSSITFKRGAPATLVFTRTTDDTCATEVVFPELSLKKDLPKNQPVAISVPTEKERTLTFQCGMGMYKSSVVIGAN